MRWTASATLPESAAELVAWLRGQGANTAAELSTS
jgi:hypothetical protein